LIFRFFFQPFFVWRKGDLFVIKKSKLCFAFQWAQGVGKLLKIWLFITMAHCGRKNNFSFSPEFKDHGATGSKKGRNFSPFSLH
jgi:hypothetical protein